ncbi:myeloid leukemia factor 1 [Gracilinanus agilis]|uniref:myeloid leukemia factor 1 n=1 Tax=Gracilinanus agilis TaxID=191870 RepID=UPI001CFD7236|nr:myeloid leukemia factor 1 [Gracilinanus agilis]
MFGSSRSTFEEDPFFSDSFTSHNDDMRQMMKSLAEPLGKLLGGIAGGGRGHQNEEESDDDKQSCSARSRALAPFGGSFGGSSLMPFGGFDAMNTDVSPFQAMDRMMSNMRNNMQDLQRSFSEMSVDPERGHSYCSSSIMTFSKVGNEPPKLFQASSQTRRAPGGIKETRKALKDSDTGIEKMAVGHHIYDRGHVIRRERNSRTGDQELNQEFINMQEADAHDFNNEWQNQILKLFQSGRKNLESARLRNGHSDSTVNYDDISRRERPRHRTAIESQRRPKAREENLHIKGSSVKSNKK